MLDAQAGRGGPPGARASSGTVERVIVHGKALEGNLEGDSPDREVTVYLPPSYAGDQTRRYPVVYLLHGYGERDDVFTGRLAKLQEIADRLAPAQGFSEPIVVIPNAFSLHKGSMYSNSVTTGDWESFIAEDLVAYVDGRYRTLAKRMSRGLAGHSMGGYGALRIGMKRPDVFSSLYIMSAFLGANSNPNPETMAAAETIKTRAQAEEAARAPGTGLPIISRGPRRGRRIPRTRRFTSISRARTARCGPTSSPSGRPTHSSRCSIATCRPCSRTTRSRSTSARRTT